MATSLDAGAKSGERCELKENVSLVRREKEAAKLLLAESIT